MKGTLLIRDAFDLERFVEVNLDTLEKNGEDIDELFDKIIAELRRDDDGISWEEVKKHLKAKSKNKLG